MKTKFFLAPFLALLASSCTTFRMAGYRNPQSIGSQYKNFAFFDGGSTDLVTRKKIESTLSDHFRSEGLQSFEGALLVPPGSGGAVDDGLRRIAGQGVEAIVALSRSNAVVGTQILPLFFLNGTLGGGGSITTCSNVLNISVIDIRSKAVV